MKVHKKIFNVIFKCSIFLLTFALLFSLKTNVTANAMTIEDSTKEITVDTNKVSNIVKLKNLNVSILEDGRIEPINNPESLTKEERTSVMKLMKFTDAEIESYPEELINDLLADGGVKVELTQEDFVHIYTDLQGIDHIVTSETMDEVNEIKQRDAYFIVNKFNLNSGVNTFAMGGKTEGTFTGKGILTYLGKTSNNTEHEYLYRTAWEWSLMPKFTFTDSVATSWQAHTTTISSTGKYTRWANGGFSHDNKVTVDKSNIQGTKATIDIQNAPGRHYGYIEDKVRIPISGNTGTTGAFSSAYAHAHVPTLMGGVSINISKYGSIDMSGIGDKWSWRNSYTIGDSK